MALIPLEDTFADVINKAQRGRKISDLRLAQIAAVSAEDLAAVKEGKPLIAVVRRVARHLHLNPDALETLANKSWYPTIPIFRRGFTMFNTPHGDMTVNSYLVWDSRTKLAAAFDTGADSRDMIDFIKAEGLRLDYIFITHSHEDHIGGLPALAKATGAQVWSSELEPCPFEGVRLFKDEAYWHLGTLSIKALLTPGHSPGLTTFLVNGLSWPIGFVGDAMFSCSIGGSLEHFDMQMRSCNRRIMCMPRDAVLAPGHGPLTTLAQEKQYNPFFAH